MTVRLRWTGPQARTFMEHGVGEVEPGRSFPVPDDTAATFLAHDNVELADPLAPEPTPGDGPEQEAEQAPAPKARRGKGTAPQSPTEPEGQGDTAS